MNMYRLYQMSFVKILLIAHCLTQPFLVIVAPKDGINSLSRKSGNGRSI